MSDSEGDFMDDYADLEDFDEDYVASNSRAQSNDFWMEPTPSSRPPEVSAVFLTNEQIIQKQKDEAKQVASVLSVSEEQALKLCHQFNWKIDSLLERFFEKGAAALGLSEAQPSLQRNASVGPDFCVICCESTCDLGFWKHPNCPSSHRFCVDCWKTHIGIKIRDGSHLIPCMSEKCQNILTDPDFIKSVTDKETFDLYTYLTAKAFVRSRKQARWCPNPNCKKAVYAQDASDSVTCECGTEFCVKCGNETHSPIGCEMLRDWQEKLASDGTSMEWVRLFSKPCPNGSCEMPIQKNGGCAFMRCVSCQAFFCWECMKVLAKDHEAHTCEPKKQKDDFLLSKSRNELQDYSKCSQGFDIFMGKGKKFHDMRPQMQRKQKEFDVMMSDNISNHQFYKTGLEALIEATRIAKYSFIFQFFSREEQKDLELLVFNQSSLVQEIETMEKFLMKDEAQASDLKECGTRAKVLGMRAQAVVRTVEEGLTKTADLYKVRVSD